MQRAKFVFIGVAKFSPVWQSGWMKNKNMRDLEKYWAEQKKKAAKPAKPGKTAAKKKSRED
jgi:hypothetical protein